MTKRNGSGITVAVIDSGWDPSRSDGRVLPGISLVADADPLRLEPASGAPDRVGHGTACTDVILRMAPACRILPVRVFGTTLETSPEIIVAALEWVSEQESAVVNLSLRSSRTAFSEEMYLACQRLAQRGAIVIAAVGSSEPSFPAAFDNVIAVGAGTFSNPWAFHWRPDRFPECLARGMRQQVLGLGGKTHQSAGSSLAAAHMSGIIACLLSEIGPADIGKIRDALAARARPDYALRVT